MLSITVTQASLRWYLGAPPLATLDPQECMCRILIFSILEERQALCWARWLPKQAPSRKTETISLNPDAKRIEG